MPSLSNDRLFGLSASVAIKAPARLATVGPCPLAGLDMIDGATPSAGDRILVKDQADPKANGVYAAAAGAWTRAPDFNGARDATAGTRLFVSEGVVNGLREFVLTSPAPVNVGVDELTFAPLASATQLNPSISIESAVAGAGQRIFNLDYQRDAAIFSVNGVVLPASDYVATDGAAVTFDEGLNAGDVVSAYSFSPGALVDSPPVAFNARLAVGLSGVTGAGAAHQIVFDGEAFDAHADYDQASGVFTAPAPGRYHFNAHAQLDGLTAAASQAKLDLVTTQETYSAEMGVAGDLPERLTLAVSALVDMAAGDTASVAVSVAGEASDNVVDVRGGADAMTFFSGFLTR